MPGSSNGRLRQLLGTLLGKAAPADTAGDHGADTYDCVVIGGGFLGLTALAQLRQEGYRAMLCTESGLGEGQSLHSHGWFHAGYLPGDVDAAAMWKAESAKTEAFVASLGADFLRPGCAYLAMPADDADSKIAQSTAVGVPMPAVPPGELPGSSGGLLAEASTSCFQTREWLFDKHRLTAALAAKHHDAIITYASPTSFERGPDGAVEAVVLSTNQRLATRSVAIAAGTGTRGVLNMLGADVDANWKSKFKSGTITMVCLNAPVGVLPDLAIMATTKPPLQVASRADDGDTITWYITPKRPVDGGDPTNFVGPGNEEAEIEAEAVAHAVEDFRTLFPALAKAASAEPSAKWGVYNGRVQRIDGHPGGPFAELTPSVPNVVVGAPSLIHMIAGTAESMGANTISNVCTPIETVAKCSVLPGRCSRGAIGKGLHWYFVDPMFTVDKLRPSLGAVRPTILHNLGELPAGEGSQSDISAGVPVGVPNEDRNGFEWMSEKDFYKKYASAWQSSLYPTPRYFSSRIGDVALATVTKPVIPSPITYAVCTLCVT